MSNLKNLQSKAAFIGSLNPAAWDALKPHIILKPNDFLVELYVADAVKSAASLIADAKYKKQAIALSLKIATKATHGMLAEWEPGDDICPPWRWPWPWPGPLGSDVFVDPDPNPWKNAKHVLDMEIIATLVTLSSLTMEKEFTTEIVHLASGIAGGISSQLSDEIERCGTVPRKRWGGPQPR